MAKGRVERRGSRRRETKPVILIVTEGSQTEPKYFEQFRTRRTNIDIQVVGSKSAGGGTDYISLVRKAIDYRDKNQLSVARGDALWVVADGDVNYRVPDPVETKDAKLTKARAMAQKADVQIAISNPCFEFWYLLHFRYSTGYLRDYDAVVALLKNDLPAYEKTSDVIAQLASHLDEALRNAARVEAYHVENDEALPFHLTVNPFTDVYRLVECLR